MIAATIIPVKPAACCGAAFLVALAEALLEVDEDDLEADVVVAEVEVVLLSDPVVEAVVLADELVEV